MNDRISIVSRSPEATERLGIRLAAILSPARVVCLRGTLGSGKTVLSRGLARGLGIIEPVTSPTFTVVQEYRRPDNSWFFHLDMYRIPDAEAALAFGIEEYLFAPDGVTAVEWPERIDSLLNGGPEGDRNDVIDIHLGHEPDDNRRITLDVDTYARLETAIQCDPRLRDIVTHGRESL